MMTIDTRVHLKENAGREWDAAMRKRLEGTDWHAKGVSRLAVLNSNGQCFCRKPPQ